MKLKKVSQSNEAIQAPQKTLLQQANEEVRNDGLKPFRESIEEDYLNFPSDFSSLPPQEGGKYLHTYTQKKVSVRSLITQYKILLDEANMELDKHKDVYFRKDRKKPRINPLHVLHTEKYRLEY